MGGLRSASSALGAWQRLLGQVDATESRRRDDHRGRNGLPSASRTAPSTTPGRPVGRHRAPPPVV